MAPGEDVLNVRTRFTPPAVEQYRNPGDKKARRGSVYYWAAVCIGDAVRWPFSCRDSMLAHVHVRERGAILWLCSGMGVVVVVSVVGGVVGTCRPAGRKFKDVVRTR